jgi:hypothetical protein
MLAVIELCVVLNNAARAATQLFGAFKYRYRDMLGGQGGSGRHARVTATDYGDIKRMLFTTAPSPSGGGLGRGSVRQCPLRVKRVHFTFLLFSTRVGAL